MNSKIELRPEISVQSFESSTNIEKFQNEILRPILKLQNEIYLSFFENYAVRQNSDYINLSAETKSIFIEQSIQKDVSLKNALIGITIGMLTKEELQNYLAESKTHNKRILTMLVERLRSQI